MGTATVLEDQQAYFVELRNQVRKYASKSPEEVKAAVDKIKAELVKKERIARYVGDFFAAQVEKAYVEMGGKPFQPKAAALGQELQHAHAHGAELTLARPKDQLTTR
jgi:hypothetical protein